MAKSKELSNLPSKDIQSHKNYNFPDMENTSEKTKSTPNYCYEIVRAIYSRFVKDKTAIDHGLSSFFDKLRLYGKGKQDPDLYKTYLGGSSGSASFDVSTDVDTNWSASRDFNRKGWMNVAWDEIVSLIPNIKTIIKGKYFNEDYDIRAHNVDINAGAKEEDAEMVKMLRDMEFGPMFDNLKRNGGLPVTNRDYLPFDRSEVDEIRAEGGFKASYVGEMEEGLKHTEDISDWDRVIKESVFDDAFDIGYIASYVDYDSETCKVKWHYADIKDCGMQFSRQSNFNDSEYGWMFRYPNVSEVKRKKGYIYSSKTGKLIDDEGLKKIISTYKSYSKNVQEVEWDNFDQKIEENSSSFDAVKVCEMKVWWIDSVNDKNIERITNRNQERYRPYGETMEKTVSATKGENEIKYDEAFPDNSYKLYVEFYDRNGNKGKHSIKKKTESGFVVTVKGIGQIKYTAEIKLDESEKIKTTRIRKTYYCTWFVGTEYVYYYGVMPNQPRGDYDQPVLPLRLVSIKGKSFCDRLVPIADEFQKSWLRFTNNLAKASRGGYAIDYGKMLQITDGDGKFTLSEILQMFREEQVYFYETGVMGSHFGGSPVPISKIEGNLAGMIAEEVAIMDKLMEMIENLTGLSPIALGAAPNPDAPVGTQQMSMVSTNAALDTLKNVCMVLKEDLAKVTCPMIQLTIKNNQKARDEYAKVIGEDGVEILKLAKNSGVRYGIKLVAGTTEAEKTEIMRIAVASLEKRNQGIGGINEGQYLDILSMIKDGTNMRAIKRQVKTWIKVDEKRIQKEKDNNVILQGQQNEKLAELQGQQAQKLEEIKLKADEKRVVAETQGDILKRNNDSERNIDEIMVEYEEKRKSEPVIPTNV